MSNTDQALQSITLKGSAQMVREYLSYAMHSVLYQRKIGNTRSYKQVNFHGLNLFVTTRKCCNDKIKNYLDDIEKFLVAKEVQSVHIYLLNPDTKEVFEKWCFKMDYETGLSSNASDVGTKDVKKIRNEIFAVLRQILGAASILPVLDDDIDLIFNLYATRMPGVPQWEVWETVPDPIIENEDKIEIKSFSTSLHKVSSEVRFKN